MFTAQAAKWHDNPLFWLKLLLLIVAVVFQVSVRRRISSERPPKLIGAVSLVLWICVALSGKTMEFV